MIFKHQKNSYMKKKVFILALSTLSLSAFAAPKDIKKLEFNASKGQSMELTMPKGEVVKYTAYERLYYVTNIEDEVYQYLNIYVPQGATEQTPIFLRTYVGGYMASQASQPQAGDATGRALQEGYVVVIPGTRGRNSTVTKGKKTIYTGRAPKAILDLKAAIRYLRHFDKEIPGNTERIITNGTSAGGAMSALMGGTGNNPVYNEYLEAMGAANERDDVFASICFCPITDLSHADMAYEWLYGNTNSRKSMESKYKEVSAELAGNFPEYINRLGLKTADGTLLTADNYLTFIKKELIRSAQIAKNAGAEIADSIGFLFSNSAMFGAPPVNGRAPLPAHNRPMPKQIGEYIVDLDMPTYLNYVASKTPLKTVPAFDSKDVAGNNASGENEEFGDETGSSINFTNYSAQKNGGKLTAQTIKHSYLLNPMEQIGQPNITVAPHWYIRHGAIDRDTSFPIPLNLALKLQNLGKDVNYLLAWNRPHSGDYALDELFNWISNITK